MDEREVKNTYGFEVSDLEGASAAGELQPTELHFDRSGYTDFNEFAFTLASLPDKPETKKPSCKSLSVNGKVVQDKMEKYLGLVLQEILLWELRFLQDGKQGWLNLSAYRY